MKQEEFETIWEKLSPLERDCLVASKVMGWGDWQWCERVWGPCDGPGWNWSVAGKDRPHISYWRPSTDMATAWDVVENLRKRGLSAHVDNKNDGYVWTVQFNPGSLKDWEDGHGDTAQEAICKAAILVVMFLEGGAA